MESSGRTSVVDAFRAGAKGVISRQDSLESLNKCVQCVRNGQVWATKEELSYAMEALTTCPTFVGRGKTPLSALSLREQQVIQCLAEGLTNREIGHRLGLSPHTVKNYLFRLFDKVGVSSRVELLYLLLVPAGTTTMNGSAPSVFACRKAAAAGSPGEQLRLAGRYREGDGVPQNLVQAYKWLLICEETLRGLATQSRSMKEKIALRMTNSDLIEAERRALEFLNDMPPEVRPMKAVSELPKAKASRVSA
jgi:DNA-binding CsgD family transcriptional regulator